MESKERRLFWLAPVCAILFGLPSPAALAAGTSLPSGIVSRHLEAEGDEYVLPPDRQGIYAHGFAGVDELPRQPEGAPCIGTEQEQQAVTGMGPTEFWFYASSGQAVLFSLNRSLNGLMACAEAASFSLEIERAFIVDGVIHSFSVAENGDLEFLSTLRSDKTAEQYSGSFDRIQSLFARGKPRGSRKHSETIAGAAAECRGQSGLVWHETCFAKNGPAKGMILRAQAGDDERIMFSNEVMELQTGADLPGKLFEIDRKWQLEGSQVGKRANP